MNTNHSDISRERSDETRLSRRDFFRLSIAAIGAFITSLVGIPVIGYVLSPALKRAAPEWTQLGPLSDFPVGMPRQVQLTRFQRDGWIERPENLAVWVWRKSETEVMVYNGHCTHLGCAYNWMTEGKHKGHFFSPCHDGVFALDSTVISGPPPRPLDTLETKIEDGIVSIIYQDFRLGVADKIPV